MKGEGHWHGCHGYQGQCAVSPLNGMTVTKLEQFPVLKGKSFLERKKLRVKMKEKRGMG